MQVGTKRSLALYLLSPAGKDCVQGIEKQTTCAVSVENRYESVLITARSPRGHQVMVCEGPLAATDCQVIALPLCAGQTEWPPLYKSILERGCLIPDAGLYRPVGGMGKSAKPHVLRCQQLTAGLTVVILHIPSSSDAQFAEDVSRAARDALHFAFSERAGLSLPMKLSDEVSIDDGLLPLLKAVIDSYDADALPLVVKFYLDSETRCPDIKSFFLSKGWLCQLNNDGSRAMDRVRVVIGDILNEKADVVVNSTDPALKHTFGSVSRAVLTAAGDRLTEQPREGVADNMVVITDAFNLKDKYTYIFHIALPTRNWNPKEASLLLEELRSRVVACLTMASVKKLSSIVFPALGTGTLGYPADLEARTVLKATKEFFVSMPHSSLRKVTFVCFNKNLKVTQTFKAEETVCRFAANRFAGHVPDRRFLLKEKLVQVVEGDALSHTCTTELLICADPPHTGTLQEYKTRAADGCLLEKVSSKNKTGLNRIGRLFLKTSALSVQVNMQTFGGQQVETVVSIIQNALCVASKVQVVIIIASSAEDFATACTQLTLLATELPRSQSPHAELATVGICGQQADTQKARAEVMKLEATVPEKYHQAEKYNLNGNFLDQPDPTATVPAEEPLGAELASAASRQNSELNAVEIPKDLVTDIMAAVCALGVSVNLSFSGRDQNTVLLKTKADNVKLLTTIAQNTMAKFPAVPTAERVPRLGTSFATGSQISSAASLEDEALAYLTGMQTSDGKADLDARHLRREDIHLTPNKCSKLSRSQFDCKSKGIEAFIKLLPYENKVSILAFTYQAIEKAKHLVKINTGKVTVRSRSKGRSDEKASSGSDIGDDPSPQAASHETSELFRQRISSWNIFMSAGSDLTSISSSAKPQISSAIESSGMPSGLFLFGSSAERLQTAKRNELTLKGNVKVRIYSADITKVQADAIVNAVDGNLQQQGGVAAAIAAAAGPALVEEGKQYVKDNGPLKVTEVAVTTSGRLSCKKVLHAAGPRWADYSDKTMCEKLLTDTVFNALSKSDSLGFTSLALTSIGSGSAGVPQQVCANSYLAAAQKYAAQRGGRITKPVLIHFVDVNKDMTKLIQTVFQSSCGKG